VVAAAPPIPVVRAGQAMALFAVGRADEARAIYDTLRQVPAAGDKDARTLGAVIQMVDLIVAFRSRDGTSRLRPVRSVRLGKPVAEPRPPATPWPGEY
jgi:hypothetical protein